MNLNIHPVNELFGVAQAILELVDDATTPVVTKAFGNVERCVSGYSKRHGFSEKLAGVFYRIWNAIKAIFGQSDWQNARRSLKEILVTLPQFPITPELLELIGFTGKAKFEKDELNFLSDRFKEINNKDLDKILNFLIGVDEIDELRKLVGNPGIQNIISDKPKLAASIPALIEITQGFASVNTLEDILNLINGLKKIPLFEDQIENIVQQVRSGEMQIESDNLHDILIEILSHIPEVRLLLGSDIPQIGTKMEEAFNLLEGLEILSNSQNKEDSSSSSKPSKSLFHLHNLIM